MIPGSVLEGSTFKDIQRGVLASALAKRGAEQSEWKGKEESLGSGAARVSGPPNLLPDRSTPALGGDR